CVRVSSGWSNRFDVW
nr:immunoglobulin heavy chain junction region [Macaca mulatta]MOX39279.1 immunoglobulin heavy chain junction region [Macaca mulatta]MOX41357.1 immunoglobulin heavy chain junction region [Macaca mulatta]